MTCGFSESLSRSADVPRFAFQGDFLVAGKAFDANRTLRPFDETFAYPMERYDHRVRPLVVANFSLACATTLGFVRPDSDPLAVERLGHILPATPDVPCAAPTPSVRGYLRLRRGPRRGARAVGPAPVAIP